MANSMFPYDGAPSMPMPSMGYAPPPTLPPKFEPWTPADEFEYRKLRKALAALNGRRQVALNNLNGALHDAGLQTHGTDIDGMLTHVRSIAEAMKPFDVNDTPQVQP